MLRTVLFEHVLCLERVRVKLALSVRRDYIHGLDLPANEIQLSAVLDKELNLAVNGRLKAHPPARPHIRLKVRIGKD